MSWYRTGTVTVTNNSNVVNGAGTDWLAVAAEGDMFQGPDMIAYEITQIVSATSLRISPAYRGGGAAGQNYALVPTRSRDAVTAAGISTLVQSYQDVRNNAGTGKFAAGTAGVPSLRGLADQDTGINFPGDNLLQLVTGGVMQLGIDAQGKLTGPVATLLVAERGSNANGSYTRFADGRMICEHTVAPQFFNTSNIGYLWTFPAVFIKDPFTTGNLVGANLPITKSLSVQAYDVSLAGAAVGALSRGDFVAGDEVGSKLQMMATGYWK